MPKYKNTFRCIENKEDFLKWAKIVNSGMTIEEKCDLQDIFAHSKRNLLDQLFIECEGDRSLILCSVYNTMAYDEVENFLKVLAGHKVRVMMEAEYAELDKRIVRVADRERIFQECKKPIFKKIQDLEWQLACAKRDRADALEGKRIFWERCKKMEADLEGYKERAEKYDAIKSLLA